MTTTTSYTPDTPIDNIEPFELIMEAQQQHGGDSLVIGAIGPRGSGKSLILCMFGLLYKNSNIPVFSNIPIGGTFGDNGNSTTVKCDDLSADALWRFDEKLNGALVIIDELQEFGGNSQEHQSVKNKLLNRLAIQIRKKSISLVYSIQSFNWVDNRLRFQTDCLIMARDMSHTDYGREHFYKRGHWSTYEFRDMSGFITGHSWDENPVPFGTINIHGKLLWPYFDSFSIVGEDEMFKKIQLKKEVYVLGKEGEEIQGYSGQQFNIKQKVKEAVDEYIKRGEQYIPIDSLQNDLGGYVNKHTIGTVMSELGLRSTQKRVDGYRQSVYSIEGVYHADD